MPDSFILTPFFLDQPLPALEALLQPGWIVNKPNLPEGLPQARMAALYQPLAEGVAQALQHGKRPVSLAGDCCTSLGVLAGLQRAGLEPSLIWLDAHGDFNTWETTPSGFLGGMPLAMLTGRGEQSIVQALAIRPMPEKGVILSDGRDLDPGEREALNASQVVHLPRVELLLERQLPAGPLWLHLDTDVLDAAVAPAQNYPVPDGPSAETLRGLFSRLNGCGELQAISISSWNPLLDADGSTREVWLSLLGALTDLKSS